MIFYEKINFNIFIYFAFLNTFTSYSYAELDSSSFSKLDSDILNRAQEKLGDVNRNKLSECQVCRALVDSFKKGLRETSRGKFEGGDTSWEESRLRSYKDSELRLVEIQEKLCEDISTGKEQCHILAEEQESEIEKWWFNVRKTGIDLIDYLCIETSKKCCPYGTYGANCSPCPTCWNRGSCKGNGTRKGSGKCSCFDGYTGEKCDLCALGYFQVSNENETSKDKSDSSSPSSESSLICEKCDSSCLSHCRHKGPKGCEVCKIGFQWDSDYGCLDIDECIELGSNPCKSNTFCVNTEGSFKCYQCDKSCTGCDGDGPDSCKQCANGYIKKNELCVDESKETREKQMEMSRYATYLGLCIATCIIFRKNIYVASFIGLMVAIYIGLAEYTVRETFGSSNQHGSSSGVFTDHFTHVMND